MRRRPLCFLCIALVVLNFVFLASGGQTESPDAFSLSDQSGDSYVTLYGEIYQCEYTNERPILYLKQTVLSEISTNINKENKNTEDKSDYFLSYNLKSASDNKYSNQKFQIKLNTDITKD